MDVSARTLNTSADDQAISLINNLTNMANISFDIFNDVKNIKKSSEVIDKIESFEKRCDIIQKTVSVMMMEVNNLKTYYKSVTRNIMDAKEKMQNQIADRKEKEIQMNTMASVYKEGEYITEFTIPYDTFGSDIMNLRMDTLIDPKDYSVLALVKRMNSDDNLLTHIDDITYSFFDKLYRVLSSVNLSINSILGNFHNVEYIERLCSDQPSELAHFKDNMLGLSPFAIDQYKLVVSKIFNIYLELNHNYQVYQKAVNSYTSLALECFFNDYSKYEIC